jgi:hypothetical protein
MRQGLLLELLGIGLLTVFMEFLVYKLLTGEFPGPHLNHFKSMLLGAFLLGSSIHLVLEVTGVNEKWCRSAFPPLN